MQATPWLDRALRIEPDNTEAAEARARAVFQLGHAADAARIQAAVNARFPEKHLSAAHRRRLERYRRAAAGR